MALEYKLLLQAIRLNAAPDLLVYISSIPPRTDRSTVAARELNMCLDAIARELDKTYFVNNDAVLQSNAFPNENLCPDGYHLNRAGTNALLLSLDKALHFVKQKTPEISALEKRCFNCGEENHLRNTCRYERKFDVGYATVLDISRNFVKTKYLTTSSHGHHTNTSCHPILQTFSSSPSCQVVITFPQVLGHL